MRFYELLKVIEILLRSMEVTEVLIVSVIMKCWCIRKEVKQKKINEENKIKIFKF